MQTKNKKLHIVARCMRDTQIYNTLIDANRVFFPPVESPTFPNGPKLPHSLIYKFNAISHESRCVIDDGDKYIIMYIHAWKISLY